MIFKRQLPIKILCTCTLGWSPGHRIFVAYVSVLLPLLRHLANLSIKTLFRFQHPILDQYPWTTQGGKMVFALIIPVVFAVLAGWTLIRLSRAIPWPEFLAQLWKGFVTLLCVSCWCVVCCMVVCFVCMSIGWLSLPFRDRLEEWEGRFIEDFLVVVCRVWQASQVSLVCVFMFGLCVIGILVVGRLRRPVPKRDGKSRDFSPCLTDKNLSVASTVVVVPSLSLLRCLLLPFLSWLVFFSLFIFFFLIFWTLYFTYTISSCVPATDLLYTFCQIIHKWPLNQGAVS